MSNPTLLDLNSVVQHPGSSEEFRLQCPLALENRDIFLAAPAEVHLKVESTGKMLLLRGSAVIDCTVPCSRCTNNVPIKLDIEIDEEYGISGTPSSYGIGGFATIDSDEPFEIFKGNSLILSNLLYEELMVQLPHQSLCSGSWDIPCNTPEEKFLHLDTGEDSLLKGNTD